jgi:branched-chain amino acid transport system ATP-binding protein
MAETLLAVSGLSKRFGGLLALGEITLSVRPGEIHAVIGPNGAGKTTLVSALAGELRPDAGMIHFAGRDISRLGPARRAALGIARSFQISSVFREFTALDNVALAVQAHQGHSFRFWRPASRDRILREPARAALAEVGLSGRADTPAAALSHGERRALELAMVLASGPRLLLLDEPMAGMGAAESAEMTALLARLKARHKESFAIVLVEHDMDAVFALADRITVLVYGRVVASGPPLAIRADPEVRRAYLGEEDAA